jgi:hypothetical protein
LRRPPTLGGAAAWPLVVRAQQAGKIYPLAQDRGVPASLTKPSADFFVTDMGKLSRILAVVGVLAVLAPGLVDAPAFAQAGSTGGTVGKINKSVSGGEEASPEPRARSHATHRASVGPRSEAGSGSVNGTWTVSATPSCLPPWGLTASVSNGVISGGATGQVSRAGAVSGNAVVLGMKFDFVGHLRGGHASGTLVGPGGCPGQWTATKS